MSAQSPIVALPADNNAGDFSVVATRLVEAACLARDGNCEAAKAQIARAMALLRGEPSTIPRNVRSPTGGSREAVRGSLAIWQKRRLTSYIDAHLTKSIRVADLADLLNLSESHFGRAFRCTFGTSAHEYVVRRRVEVAQSLMLRSRDPLCAIALHCGLSDQSHFTRVFRRIVGETPYVWRRARWGELDDQLSELSSSRSDRRRVSVLSNRAEPAY
jgi:AraC family transcriptional regulator